MKTINKLEIGFHIEPVYCISCARTCLRCIGMSKEKDIILLCESCGVSMKIKTNQVTPTAPIGRSKGRGRPKGSLDKRYAPYGGVFGYRKYVSEQKKKMRELLDSEKIYESIYE